MRAEDIRLRDPFILPYEGKYYLFGTAGHGFNVWTSTDLTEFEGPYPAFRPAEGFWGTTDFWAPEVHFYKGAFYMFASFIGEGYNRGTAILRSEKPEGPYLPWSDGAVTPKDWMCLDGTLVIEDGRPYMVFCHEWVQVGDGEMLAMELTDDLKSAAGKPVLLFTAKSAGWTDGIRFPDRVGYVTDGPFLRRKDGKLWMFWASFKDDENGESQYAEGIALSENGVMGPWKHMEPMFTRDGGHGMVFEAFDGQTYFVLHRPNTKTEHPVFFPLTFEGGKWSVTE